MKRIVTNIMSLFLISALLLSGCKSNKATPTEALSSGDNEVHSKLENYMKDYLANNQFNGSILVAKNEKILFENGYGMADADNKIPNTPKTVFEIGSITKQFTATAILMLKEKGLLNIQDTLDKYIPDYPNGNKIKIYNLLNHTSGIPEYLNFVDSMEAGKHTYTPKDIIELFKNKQLNFNPGTKYEYSNSNYILLGYIIEKVTGTSYEDYIKNNIFDPLKMNHTGFLNSKETVDGKAIGYSYVSPKGTAYEKSYETEPTLPYAAGGMYSNVEDLLAWNNDLCSGKVISRDSLKEMFTPYLDSYGFGWYISNIDGDDIIEHGGNIPGFTSDIARYIDKGYVVIILSNNSGHSTNLPKISDGLLQIVKSY